MCDHTLLMMVLLTRKVPRSTLTILPRAIFSGPNATTDSSRTGCSWLDKIAGAALVGVLFWSQCDEVVCSGGTKGQGQAPGVRPGMKVYTRKDVANHNSLYTGVWTTFGNGVYDITKFIENHPGGAEKAQLAAGGQLEHYWNLYRQHYNSPTPKNLLGEMCIGVLDPKEVAEMKRNEDLSDPYHSDPEISPVLRHIQKKPANAEAPGALLAHSWLTPNSVHFVRNHHPVPVIKESDEEYKVQIQIGNGKLPIELSLHDLKTFFKKREIIATLQVGFSNYSCEF